MRCSALVANVGSLCVSQTILKGRFWPVAAWHERQKSAICYALGMQLMSDSCLTAAASISKLQHAF